MSDQDTELEIALRQLEVTAANFAARTARMASVRQAYVKDIAAMSAEIRAQVEMGTITARKGAALANAQRNHILEVQRARDLDLGRAYAKTLKKNGLPLDEAIEKAMHAKGFGGMRLSELTDVQQRVVYDEVVAAAGRSRASATRGIPKLRWASRGLFVATIAIAVYNVGTAEDPWWQTGREGANLVGGGAGGFAGGAAAGALGGMWAGPPGVAVGVLVGGVLGALLADRAYVEAAGVADDGVAPFLAGYTSFIGGVDSAGLAKALAGRARTSPEFVERVFLSLDSAYWTSADDVAHALVQQARADARCAQAIRSRPSLKKLLIELLESGWTSDEEKKSIAFLRT